MKTPKTKFLFLAAVPAVCVLAALSGVLVCESSLPYMTKYSFIMLLLAGLCVLLVLMINSYEHVSEQLKGGLLVKKEEELEAAKVKQQETDQKLQASQKELRALQFQMDELKAKISAFRPETAKGSAPASETELLRKKCEAIENFRNSFPYRIADGYILYNIMRTEIQVSCYSRWQLVGEFDNQLWEYSLLRPDTQSYKEMLSLAAATSSPQELGELNVSGQLLWN